MSEQHLSLGEGLRSPARARAWATQLLPSLPVAVTEDVLLVVSELVTNAVRHGGSGIVLTMAVMSDRVRVSVTDTGAALPVVAAGQPSIDRPTGRGLLIVAATALDWGVEMSADHSGKTVWADIAVPS